jgi:hypothetical protein
MSLRKSITPLVKIAFGLLVAGATVLTLTATTSFLPVIAVPISFAVMFIGAGALSLFWKPKKLPEEREVMLYACAKCHRQLTHSEVYLLEGKNIPENRRCKACYTEDSKPKDVK